MYTNAEYEVPKIVFWDLVCALNPRKMQKARADAERRASHCGGRGQSAR